MSSPDRLALQRDVALVDLVDRLLAGGVVLCGDLTLSLADVDLISLCLQVLVTPAEEIHPPGLARSRRRRSDLGLRRPRASGGGVAARQPAAAHLVHRGSGEITADSPADKLLTTPPDLNPFAGGVRSADKAAWRPLDADPGNVERGLAQLVLTIVELLRQLMERQALRRVEAGGLDGETVERLGCALMALADRMEELKQTFGLCDEDLHLNLGPLGRLL